MQIFDVYYLQIGIIHIFTGTERLKLLLLELWQKKIFISLIIRGIIGNTFSHMSLERVNKFQVVSIALEKKLCAV